MQKNPDNSLFFIMESCSSNHLYYELIKELDCFKKRVSFVGYKGKAYRFKLKNQQLEIGGFLSYIIQNSITLKTDKEITFKDALESIAKRIYEKFIAPTLANIESIKIIEEKIRQKIFLTENEKMLIFENMRDKYKMENYINYFAFYNLEIWEELPFQSLFKKMRQIEETSIFFEKESYLKDDIEITYNENFNFMNNDHYKEVLRYANTLDSLRKIKNNLNFPNFYEMNKEWQNYLKISDPKTICDFLHKKDNQIIMEIYEKRNNLSMDIDGFLAPIMYWIYKSGGLE